MFKRTINIINRNILIFFPIVWSFGPAIQDIAVSFIAISFIFFCFAHRDFEFINDKISWILIAFFISIIISSIFSPIIETSFYKSSVYMRYLLFFFAVNYLIKFDSGDLRKFCIINISFILFLSLDIWFQKINGADIFGFQPGMDGMRNSGFFGDEWIAGGFIAKTFFLTSIFFLLTKTKKIYLFSFYFFTLITIFFTGERMALILFIIGTLLFVIIYKDLLKHKIIYFSAIFLSVTIFLIFNPQTYYRVVNQTLNQIIYGHSDKYHKYFNIEITHKNKLDERKDIDKNNFIFAYQDDLNSNFSLNQNTQNFIYQINKEKKFFKVTNINLDSYEISGTHFEKIDIEVEYIRGKNIGKMKNMLENIFSDSKLNIYEDIQFKLLNPRKFDLKMSFPLIDTGWGAHFLAAVNIWLDKPFFGNGLKTFRELCGYEKYKTISKNDIHRCSTHPHNFYFELLAETGIIGLILLASFFIGIAKKAKIIRNKNEIFFLIILILSIWPLGTTGSLFNNHNAGIFWFIISFTYYTFRNKDLFFTTND